MVEDQHISEDLHDLFGSVFVLVAFKQRNKHIVLPKVVQAILGKVNLVDFEDVLRFELS